MFSTPVYSFAATLSNRAINAFMYATFRAEARAEVLGYAVSCHDLDARVECAQAELDRRHAAGMFVPA
jgi:hypothetical protein